MIVEEMTQEDCRKAVASAEFGRLACVRDGQPYIVPVSFAVDGDYAYLFSMPGQKVQWMRENPRVCLEVDRVSHPTEWTSIVVLGSYEELDDTPALLPDRLRMKERLQLHADWWLPGAVALANRDAATDVSPVFYRIYMEQWTGRRGVPATDEVAGTTS